MCLGCWDVSSCTAAQGRGGKGCFIASAAQLGFSGSVQMGPDGSPHKPMRYDSLWEGPPIPSPFTTQSPSRQNQHNRGRLSLMQ